MVYGSGSVMIRQQGARRGGVPIREISSESPACLRNTSRAIRYARPDKEGSDFDSVVTTAPTTEPPLRAATPHAIAIIRRGGASIGQYTPSFTAGKQAAEGDS